MGGVQLTARLAGAVLSALVVACSVPAAPGTPEPSRPPDPAATVTPAAAPTLDPEVETEPRTAVERASDEARATELQWVLAAHHNRDPHLTPNGETVVYRSTRAGDEAVWRGRVAAPELAPTRLWPCRQGCDLVGISGDGQWAGLRLGGTNAAQAPLLALRIDGGAPELDRSPPEARRPAATAAAAWPDPAAVGPCGAPLPGATAAQRDSLGVVGVLQGSPAAFVWQSPLVPPDLWRLDAVSGALRPLRNEARPGLAALGDARLEVDAAAGVVTLLPTRATEVVALVVGTPAQPVAGWDPVARALAGRGVAVVRTCATASGSATALSKWLDAQAFAAGKPWALINAGPGSGLAARALPTTPGVTVAVAAPWWWDADPATRSAGAILDSSARWRRSLRLAALERTLLGMFPPRRGSGGVD